MYVYILRCDNQSLYTGITSDISKRIRQHLGLIAGGAKYTHSHQVVFIEALWKVSSDTAARRLESALKKFTHSQKEKLISDPRSVTDRYCVSLQEYEYESIEVSEYNNDFNFKKSD